MYMCPWLSSFCCLRAIQPVCITVSPTYNLKLHTTVWCVFQINVGCGTEPTDKYPVRLEYTADGGNTWSLVVPNCALTNLARCFDTTLPPTLYYGGTTAFWRRIIVPLDNVHVCGYVFQTALWHSHHAPCNMHTCWHVMFKSPYLLITWLCLWVYTLYIQVTIPFVNMCICGYAFHFELSCLLKICIYLWVEVCFTMPLGNVHICE